MLSPREREVFDKITEYIKKNPEASVDGACKTLGLSYVPYYKARRKLIASGVNVPKTGRERNASAKATPEIKVKRAYNKKPKMQTLIVPEVNSKNVIVLFVPHTELSSTLRQLTGV